MPKNKRLKYERVKGLPNVTLAMEGAAPPKPYPWCDQRYAGLPVTLELGCGKGEHSLAFAAADSGRLFVGMDYKSHRLCVGAEDALVRGLGNVLFVCGRAERIREFFVPHSLAEIWLTFPDPLLKNRKAKARLSAPAFLDAYADLLRPGGRVHLKTDSRRFIDYTRESVLRWGGRVVVDREANWADPGHAVSAYEKAALSKGKAITYLVFALG